MNVAAVVLAAGASKRMKQVKALIRVRGKSLLDHLLSRISATDCAPIVVVSGAHDLQIVIEPETTRIQEVHNNRWHLGQLSSTQVGLSNIDQNFSECSGAIVFTVDRPFVDVSTILAMIEAHRRHPEAILQPGYEGQRGHPILIPRRWFSDWLALQPTDSARTLFSRMDISLARQVITVEDPAIFDNFDRREDFEGMVDVEF